jgi:hypothetical protein
MRVVEQLEKPVVQAFKSFPSMPNDAKETLVKAWPYLALVFGVLQLLVALGAWNVIQVVDRYVPYAAYTAVAPSDRVIIYVGIALLVAEAVVLFMAFSPLQKRIKRGWDLLFLGSTVNVVYALVALFMSGYGMGSFFMSVLTSTLGFYLLVQIREKYTGKASMNAKIAKPRDTEKK